MPNPVTLHGDVEVVDYSGMGPYVYRDCKDIVADEHWVRFVWDRPKHHEDKELQQRDLTVERIVWVPARHVLAIFDTAH